jgi:arylsulfotransferase ASST
VVAQNLQVQRYRGRPVLTWYESVAGTTYGGSWVIYDSTYRETSRVLFEWHSLHHVPLSETYRAEISSAGNVDYFHLNSIAVDPRDGHLLVSSRHTSTIYKLDRRSGAIRWRLATSRSAPRRRCSCARPEVEADAGTRTPDPIITSDVLYQLSYVGGPREV